MSDVLFYAWAILDPITNEIINSDITRNFKECEMEAKNKVGGRFRKFLNKEDAEKWLKNPIIRARKPLYAVHCNSGDFIFSDYARLESLKDSFSKEENFQYKGFNTQDEAELWLAKIKKRKEKMDKKRPA